MMVRLCIVSMHSRHTILPDFIDFMNSELTWKAELYCKDSGLRKPALREFHAEPVSQRFERFSTIEDIHVRGYMDALCSK